MSQQEAQQSCGLKNSGCPPTNDNDVSVERDDSTKFFRFAFVDGITGLWTTTLTTSTAFENGNYPDEIVCPVGGLVVFHYPQSNHDVARLPSQEAWDSCNLTNAIILSPSTLPSLPTEPNLLLPDVSYYFNCSEPNTTSYITCSVPGHCEAGQKVKIRTSATEYAFDVESNEWNIHVASISRILRLLNSHQDDETGLFIMDHGYQTEELADATLELIWCAMDHCPMAARDVSHTATREDCESMIYTLMGFVSRKRPVPQWNISEDYYRKAIQRGGSNECAAQSYISQLFWSKGEYATAVNETTTLCRLCSDTEPLLVAQTKLDFDKVIRMSVASGGGAKEPPSWPNECLPLVSDGQTSATPIPTHVLPAITFLLNCLLVWLR